jgi:hypothetical protein
MIKDGTTTANRTSRGGATLPKLIGLACALISLVASVMSKADPATALMRAAIAFFVGSILTQAWYVFIATRIATVDELPSIEEVNPPDKTEKEAQSKKAA